MIQAMIVSCPPPTTMVTMQTNELVIDFLTDEDQVLLEEKGVIYLLEVIGSYADRAKFTLTRTPGAPRDFYEDVPHWVATIGRVDEKYQKDKNKNRYYVNTWVTTVFCAPSLDYVLLSCVKYLRSIKGWQLDVNGEIVPDRNQTA